MPTLFRQKAAFLADSFPEAGMDTYNGFARSHKTALKNCSPRSIVWALARGGVAADSGLLQIRLSCEFIFYLRWLEFYSSSVAGLNRHIWV